MTSTGISISVKYKKITTGGFISSKRYIKADGLECKKLKKFSELILHAQTCGTEKIKLRERIVANQLKQFAAKLFFAKKIPYFYVK